MRNTNRSRFPREVKLWLSDDQADGVRRLADHEGASVSGVIRRAIVRALREAEVAYGSDLAEFPPRTGGAA